jgi:hypothetical protein
MSPTTSTTPTDPNALPDWYDPFPEPRTYPKGWDLSEILKEKQPVSKAPAGD